MSDGKLYEGRSAAAANVLSPRGRCDVRPSRIITDYRLSDKKAQLTLSNPRDVKSMQKLLQFDAFRFISPNSISPNFKAVGLGLYSYTQFEIWCLPIAKFLV